MSITEDPVSAGLAEPPLREVKTAQETIKCQDDDWESDPQNARNWTFAQKWTAVLVVCLRFLILYVLELSSGIPVHIRYRCILL